MHLRHQAGPLLALSSFAANLQPYCSLGTAGTAKQSMSEHLQTCQTWSSLSYSQVCAPVRVSVSFTCSMLTQFEYGELRALAQASSRADECQQCLAMPPSMAQEPACCCQIFGELCAVSALHANAVTSSAYRPMLVCAAQPG